MNYLSETRRTLSLLSDNGEFLITARLTATVNGANYRGSSWRVSMYRHAQPVRSINSVSFDGVRVCKRTILQAAKKMGCFTLALLSHR